MTAHLASQQGAQTEAARAPEPVDLENLTTHQMLALVGFNSKNEPTPVSSSARCIYRHEDGARFGHMSADKAHAFGRLIHGGTEAVEAFVTVTGHQPAFTRSEEPSHG